MKKQTVYMYILGFVSVILLAGSCYLVSYQITKRQFDQKLAQYQAEQLTSEAEADLGLQDDQGESDDMVAAAADSVTIHSETEYILEIYDMQEDYLSEYELNPPAYLVGLDRKGLEQYVADYMEHVPLDEFQMGLLSYEIISFSGEKVVLRKVYDQSTVPYQYYLVIERGYLVVYYADQKTVYEYTGIDARKLPEEEQVKLAYGIFLKDQKELYGLLQGYSS